MLTLRTLRERGRLFLALAWLCAPGIGRAQTEALDKQAPAAAASAPPAQPESPMQATSPEPASASAGALRDDSQALDDEARQRFELGRTFYEAGRFQQAAEEFAEAYRLSGRPQLVYNVYVAQRDAANWPAAIDALRSYLAMVPDAPDRINLRARLSSMEEQAARLQASQQRAQSPAPQVEHATRVETERSTLPWILVGAGGALALASIGTGILAERDDKKLDTACADEGTVCPTAERDEANKTRAFAIATDVLWATGAAAIVTGFVLMATGALDRERRVPVLSFGASARGMSAALTLRY